VLAEFALKVLPTTRKADRVNDGDSIHAHACTRQEVGAKSDNPCESFNFSANLGVARAELSRLIHTFLAEFHPSHHDRSLQPGVNRQTISRLLHARMQPYACLQYIARLLKMHRVIKTLWFMINLHMYVAYAVSRVKYLSDVALWLNIIFINNNFINKINYKTRLKLMIYRKLIEMMY